MIIFSYFGHISLFLGGHLPTYITGFDDLKLVEEIFTAQAPTRHPEK